MSLQQLLAKWHARYLGAREDSPAEDAYQTVVAALEQWGAEAANKIRLCKSDAAYNLSLTHGRREGLALLTEISIYNEFLRDFEGVAA